jgi:hypothetical protein
MTDETLSLFWRDLAEALADPATLREFILESARIYDAANPLLPAAPLEEHPK